MFLTVPSPVPLMFIAAKGPCLPGVGSRVGVPSMWFELPTPWGGSLNLCNVTPRGAGPNLIASVPFLPSSLWVFSYSLSCIRVFLLVFRLFSVRIAPNIDVFLMCSWEVNSAFSSAATLISSSINILVYVFWRMSFLLDI